MITPRNVTIYITICLFIYLLWKEDDHTSTSTQPLPQVPLSSTTFGYSSRFIKMMMIGDGITQGCCREGVQGYRYYLWQKMNELAYTSYVDFIGSKNTSQYPNDFISRKMYPLFDLFDKDHEGHAGWGLESILKMMNDASWWSSTMSGVLPDVVLIHLGAADMLISQISDITSNLQRMIQTLRDHAPRVNILLAQIIPTYHKTKTTIAALDSIPTLNEEIAKLALEMDTLESPVTLVDLYTGFEEKLIDSVDFHPNLEGEEWMASKWWSPLQIVLNTMLNTTKI